MHCVCIPSCYFYRCFYLLKWRCADFVLLRYNSVDDDEIFHMLRFVDDEESSEVCQFVDDEVVPTCIALFMMKSSLMCTTLLMTEVFLMHITLRVLRLRQSTTSVTMLCNYLSKFLEYKYVESKDKEQC